jgi:hypothetical protein
VHNVISGMNEALHTPILGLGMPVGHAHGYVMGKKEGVCSSIIKPLAIITLDGFDGSPKLSTDMSKEVRQSLKCV